MTPRILTYPLDIRGDVPGLLARGMPVHWRDEETPYVVMAPPFYDAGDALWLIAAPCAGVPIGVQDDPSNFAVDWSSPLAIYAALHWLSTHRHDCWWMRPTEVGGRTADWNEAAILVSVSVGRVAVGEKPVEHMLSPWRWIVHSRMWARTTIGFSLAVSESGWAASAARGIIGNGPETGDAGKAAADAAALADGAALLGDDGAVVVGVPEVLAVLR